jgi:hypothetical protein
MGASSVAHDPAVTKTDSTQHQRGVQAQKCTRWKAVVICLFVPQALKRLLVSGVTESYEESLTCLLPQTKKKLRKLTQWSSGDYCTGLGYPWCHQHLARHSAFSSMCVSHSSVLHSTQLKLAIEICRT